jgi:plastocyanin
MSKSVKRGSLGLLFVILAVVGAFAVASSTAASRPAPREITLVAEDMAFYLADAQGPAREPNPTLVVRRGETVRLVLVNRDRGMDHDFVAGALEVATSLVPGDGSTTSAVFEAPTEPGRHEYLCSLHARMMRGVLEVR